MTDPFNIHGLPNPLLDPTNPASPLHRTDDVTDINHPLNPLNPNNPNRLLAQETDRILNSDLGTSAGTDLGVDAANPMKETQAIGAVVGELHPVGSEWVEPVKQIIGSNVFVESNLWEPEKGKSC